MARVVFSPIISQLSGKTADVVFATWKGIAYIRSRVIPANPRSAAQTLQRDALAHTLTMWQSVKTWAQTLWNEYATGYAKSGYNRYMEDNILLVKAATAGTLTPYNADYIWASAMAAVAGGAGEISCSWTDDTGVDADYVFVYFRKLQAGSEEYEWTFDKLAGHEHSPIVIAGLDTGESYEVAIVPMKNDRSEAQESYNEILAAG